MNTPDPGGIAPVAHRPLRVGLVGTYVPRRCGIATFTADLAAALMDQGLEVVAVPVTDVRDAYDYPAPVRFEVMQDDPATYAAAGRFLNDAADIVCVQHEYGIFGGDDGRHLLALLAELRRPLVTSLHTVLESPTAGQRRVMDDVVSRSDRVVPLSRIGGALLRQVHHIARGRIQVIPHGIPDVGFIDPAWFKDHFGLAGRPVLLTFGLLSPNKGIEEAIAALPALVAEFPGLVYLVVGATHPRVRAEQGEQYRASLLERAAELGVGQNLRLHDAYVDMGELLAYIGAADVYLTPYQSRQQIVSGTLAYALGAGKAVVSTPYHYAVEMLAGDRGVLVPFHDPAALAGAVGGILRDEPLRSAMRKRAYLAGRHMIWSEVGRRYVSLFDDVRQERTRSPRLVGARRRPNRPARGSLLSLDHLVTLTDDVGVLQHASFSIPARDHGYTTDDNARALALALRLVDQPRMRRLARTCMAFVSDAFDPGTGRFRNLMSWSREWRPDLESDDCHGRAVAALGEVVNARVDDGWRRRATELLRDAMPAFDGIGSPRAWASGILGLAGYVAQVPGDLLARRLMMALGERLHDCYLAVATGEWQWFEESLTYANATLPHALLVAGDVLHRADFVADGLVSLAWLCRRQRPDGGHFVPVGCSAPWHRGGERPRFDQQPLEAGVTVSACLAANRISGDHGWTGEARLAWDWFFGANDLGISLVDPGTGGCRDGLHADRLNQNQGAESTLALLQATVELNAHASSHLLAAPRSIGVMALSS